ncbi:hypothetical protein GW846_05325 [Candidatus Gracilibacteria bacterium]|nr:hypothetical protein [Candidatus Gracilibacteria bacterium]
MTTQVDTKFYKDKKSINFYLSLGFLAVVILATLGLFFYNNSIDNNIVEMDAEIANLEKSIDDVQSDPLVMIYGIYSKHKSFLDEKSKQSQIPLFVSHLRKNFIKYSIDATGFSYSEGELTIELSNQTTDNGYAYEKVVKFLREYPQDEKSLFDIDDVESFEGYDKIGYSANFVLR